MEIDVMPKSDRRITSTAIGVSLALGCFAAVSPAVSAPPTVQYSPGYDMRLAEARRNAELASPQPMVVVPRVRHRRHHHRD
jgi:hypothetical protein